LLFKVKIFCSQNYTTHNTDHLNRETLLPNFVEVYYTVKYLKVRDTPTSQTRGKITSFDQERVD